MSPRPIDLPRVKAGLARLNALLDAHPELREPEAQARLTAWLEEEQCGMTSSPRKKRGDPQTRARVQRLRERRKHAGMKAFELWLDADSVALLAELKQPGETLHDTVGRALHALASVTGNVTSIGPSNDSHEMLTEPLSYEQRKAAIVARVREMHVQGLSLQAIANELNREGVPTLSSKGRWQKGTISNLLAQG